MADEWLTTAEAAELSGYHRVYLTDLVRHGKVVGRKFGPVWQVSKASLLEYLASAKQSGDDRRGPK